MQYCIKSIKKNLLGKIALFLYCFLSVLYAGSAGNNDIASEKDQQKITQKYNDYEEVVYAHLKLNEQKPERILSAKAETFFYIRPEENNTSNSNNDANRNDQNNSSETYFISGYCFSEGAPMEIARLSSYSYMKCNFDNIVAINKNAKIPNQLSTPTLAALLVPDAFSKALIGKPLYLNVGQRRFPVLGGVIMNYEKTSINLAHIVNDRKIETFLANSGIKMADVATNEAQSYISAKKEASRNQEVVFQAGTGSSQTIVTSNNTQPDPSDYLMSGGIKMISELIKAGGEVFKEDLPFLFQTKENAIYYVDLMVTDDLQSLPNLNMSGTSLARKNSLESAKTQSEISLTGANNPSSNNGGNNSNIIQQAQPLNGQGSKNVIK